MFSDCAREIVCGLLMVEMEVLMEIGWKLEKLIFRIFWYFFEYF